jgi:hypothetical protein
MKVLPSKESAINEGGDDNFDFNKFLLEEIFK